MSGSGRWSQQIVFKNCGKEYCQQGCSLNRETKPHGPYAKISRRNPDQIYRHDEVYLGKLPLSVEQLEIINEAFLGPSVPTKAEIFLVLEQAELAKVI
jgi:hypothetical protein